MSNLWGYVYPIILAFFIAQIYYQGVWQLISVGKRIVSLSIPALLAANGIKKKNVNYWAAITGYILTAIILMASYTTFTAVLVFYCLGTTVTKKYNPSTELGGRRYIQVVATIGGVALFSLFKLLTAGPEELPIIAEISFSNQHYYNTTTQLLFNTAFQIMSLGAISCALGDTLASEMAPAYARANPLLITRPWRTVPIGTNGGVTIEGLFLSALGGGVIGLVYTIGNLLLSVNMSLYLNLAIIVMGIFSGLFGSIIDSILGAELQLSLHKDKRICGIDVLDNPTVNLISSSVTSLVAIHLWWKFFF